MKKYIKLLNIFAVLALFSCKPKADTSSYLQNIEDTAVQTSIQNAKSSIQVNDELMILVTAKDKSKKYIHRERKYAQMSRSILLADANEESVQAKLEEGVLILSALPNRGSFLFWNIFCINE